MINLQSSARVDLVRPEKFRTFCTAEICTGERAGETLSSFAGQAHSVSTVVRPIMTPVR